MDFYNLRETDQEALDLVGKPAWSTRTINFLGCREEGFLNSSMLYEGINVFHPRIIQNYRRLTHEPEIAEFMIDNKIMSSREIFERFMVFSKRHVKVEYFQLLVEKGFECTPFDFYRICVRDFDMETEMEMEIIRFFVGLGQDLNTIPEGRSKPPFLAMGLAGKNRGPPVDILKNLIDLGADPHLIIDGKRAIDIILDLEYGDEMVNFALDLGADPNVGYEEFPDDTPLLSRLFYYDGSIVDIDLCIRLIQTGAKFNDLYRYDDLYRDYDYDDIEYPYALGTALGIFITVSSNHCHIEEKDVIRIIRALVEADRSILDKPDSIGRTPLRYAADDTCRCPDYLEKEVECEIYILKLLLELGADPNITDNEGFTPLQKASRPEIIDLLKGA